MKRSEEDLRNDCSGYDALSEAVSSEAPSTFLSADADLNSSVMKQKSQEGRSSANLRRWFGLRPSFGAAFVLGGSLACAVS